MFRTRKGSEMKLTTKQIESVIDLVYSRTGLYIARTDCFDIAAILAPAAPALTDALEKIASGLYDQTFCILTARSALAQRTAAPPHEPSTYPSCDAATQPEDGDLVEKMLDAVWNGPYALGIKKELRVAMNAVLAVVRAHDAAHAGKVWHLWTSSYLHPLCGDKTGNTTSQIASANCVVCLRKMATDLLAETLRPKVPIAGGFTSEQLERVRKAIFTQGNTPGGWPYFAAGVLARLQLAPKVPTPEERVTLRPDPCNDTDMCGMYGVWLDGASLKVTLHKSNAEIYRLGLIETLKKEAAK